MTLMAKFYLFSKDMLRTRDFLIREMELTDGVMAIPGKLAVIIAIFSLLIHTSLMLPV